MCVNKDQRFLNIDFLELVFEIQSNGLAESDFLPSTVYSFVVAFVFVDVLEEHEVLR
jgi:hypothetical protein